MRKIVREVIRAARAAGLDIEVGAYAKHYKVTLREGDRSVSVPMAGSGQDAMEHIVENTLRQLRRKMRERHQ